MRLDRVVRHIKKVRIYEDSVPLVWASVAYPQKSTYQSAGRVGVRNNRLTRHVQVHYTVVVDLP